MARFDDGIAAFADARADRRARLSAGNDIDSTLQCTYHGWRSAQDGRCERPSGLSGTRGHHRCGAALAAAAEAARPVPWSWLAAGPPRAPLPDLHRGVPLGTARHRDGCANAGPEQVEADAAILIDNFLDEAHLPFVHAATIGGPPGRNPSRAADVDRRDLRSPPSESHAHQPDRPCGA